jgi:hypothetical protein
VIDGLFQKPYIPILEPNAHNIPMLSIDMREYFGEWNQALVLDTSEVPHFV